MIMLLARWSINPDTGYAHDIMGPKNDFVYMYRNPDGKAL
jgi:hypothetical protein